jgi:hypothetical protein
LLEVHIKEKVKKMYVLQRGTVDKILEGIKIINHFYGYITDAKIKIK